jgi:alpha-glucosidase
VSDTRPWWAAAVGYQVYLRSFADGDGDGLGDLAGLDAHLDHLIRLGIDLVWITPFYPTPDHDHGYDVADHLDVDPRFGDLAAFDTAVATIHDAGLRILLDIVPNHTSDRHRWFQRAVADRDAPEHDYYVWVDGHAGDGPPNNWRSHFGGPAWTHRPEVGRWYLHRFLPEQPDLNWRNPAVFDRFVEILEFWFARGVDGFRIDVAHGLLVDEHLRSNPEPALEVDLDAEPRAAFDAIDHVHDLDQPGVPDLFRHWRRVADRHDALLLGEVYLAPATRVARYLDGDALHAAFYFPTLHTGWDAAAIRPVLVDGVKVGAGRFAWPLSSHDDPRAATRFGGGARGTRRALAYFALLAALPGMPFLFQGDELGLENGRVDHDHLSDPISVRHRGAPGRDGSRTPMPWEPGPAFGFTTGQPWLPLGDNRRDVDTVASQADDDASPLALTRRLLATRRTRTAMLATDAVRWHDLGDEVIGLTRGDVTVLTSFADAPATVSLPRPGAVVHTTAAGASADGSRLLLPPDATVWVADDPLPQGDPT